MNYDAFLSYSHTTDADLAPVLRDALHKVAKPWYRRRAVHVFLDRSNLAANPNLWPSIELALRSSRYFVLLCSPASAKSTWVERELECWFEIRSSAQLLLVLTEGELNWNQHAADFDWERTNAISTTIRGRITEEPLYVDMRWARHETSLSFEDARFLDVVSSLVAPIRGIEKEELASEEVRQHRRTRRTAWSAGISLTVLLAAAIVFGIAALQRGFELEGQLTESERARLVAQNELGRRLNSEGNVGRALVTLADALPVPYDPVQYDPRLAGIRRDIEVELTRTLLNAGQIADARFSWRTVDVSDAVALSSDGTRLAVHKLQTSIGHNPENNKIETVETDGARKLATIYVPGTELVSELSFLDGSRLLFVQPLNSDGMVVNPENGQIISPISRRDFWWVAQKSARLFGYDQNSGTFTVINLSTGVDVTTIDPPDEARLHRIALTPKNEIAVILYTDGSLVLQSPADPQQKRLTVTDTGRVSELYGSLAGSNAVLVSTESAFVAYLNAETGVIQPLDSGALKQLPALAAALPGGRIAYVEKQSSSFITFQQESASRPRRSELEGRRVTVLIGTAIGDGVLAGNSNGEVYWVPYDDDRLAIVVSGAADQMTQLAVSERWGLLVVGHQSGTIRVFRAPGMQETLILRGHTAPVMELSLSEDSAELVSASADGTVRRWWITPPAAQIVVPRRAWSDEGNEHEDIARRRMALAPNGRSIALRDDDHRVSVWNVDGEQRFTVSRDGIVDFGFMPDSGRVFVVDASGALEIRDLNGKHVSPWGDAAPPTGLWDLEIYKRTARRGRTYSPDGQRYFTAKSSSKEGEGGVWLYRAGTGELLWKEISLILDPSGVSFSPDSAYLIVYDRSNSPGIAFSPALLVDAERGVLVSDLSRPAGRILDASFDLTGRWLFGMTDDGAVVRWRTLSRPGEAQQLALDQVERWGLANPVPGE